MMSIRKLVRLKNLFDDKRRIFDTTRLVFAVKKVIIMNNFCVQYIKNIYHCLPLFDVFIRLECWIIFFFDAIEYFSVKIGVELISLSFSR